MINIGDKYLSNIQNSSGRTYEVILIKNPELITGIVRVRDINEHRFRAVYNILTFKHYIEEGRLILIP